MFVRAEDVQQRKACANGEVRADRAQCVEVRKQDPNELWLWVPRAALAIPRLAFSVLTAPIGLLQKFETQYRVSERIDELLWNDAHTIGVIPTAFYETGLSPSVGLRFINSDTFGHRERLFLRTAFGGGHNQLYYASIDSGKRFVDARQQLSVAYRRHENGRFYGAGDLDVGPAPPPSLRLNALSPPHAVATRYDLEQVDVGVTSYVDLAPLPPPFELRVQQRIRYREVDTTGKEKKTPWVDQVFSEESLVGLGDKELTSYTEIGMRYDTRQSTRADMPRALPSRGLYVDAWSGVQVAISGGEAPFGRVGFDVQPFFDLFRGDRVLRLRARFVSLVGPTERIPFADLPSLGGGLLLRGYPSRRFSGQATMLMSAEYRYPVQEGYAIYGFVDAGRAYARTSDMRGSALLPSRFGFGGGVVFYSMSDLSLRMQLATSIEGGFILFITLDGTDELRSTM
jgi:hypothetical protein